MRALITGSAGLIGRHFAVYLFDKGWEISCLDLKQGQDALSFFRYGAGSYDLVVHCAAHVGGRLDIENKRAFIGAYNVQLDAAMFEWALRAKPAHVVYWSSSAAYPLEYQTQQLSYALRENDIDILYPAPADKTYGWAKLVGERLAQEVKAEGIKVHIFRPFSGWASDQDLTYPMGAYLDRARQKADPFTIWGDGNQVRDFIHIDDIIGATVSAVEADYDKPLNLCTGVPTSFNQLAKLVTSAAGYLPAIEYDRTKPEGVRYRVGDPTELHKIWVPRVTLEDGIKKAMG